MGLCASTKLTEEEIAVTPASGKISKASRRDSVAVHKKHIAKKKTADSKAPSSMKVEIVED